MQDNGKEHMRAFVCVDIPGNLMDKAVDTVKELPRECVRPVRRDNTHITLFFFERLAVEKVDIIKNVLDAITIEKFNISIKGVSSFTKSHPRVLLARISEGTDELMQIYDSILAKVEKADIKTDKRNYTPHLTLARIRNESCEGILDEFIEKNEELQFGSFVCDSIRLKRSILTAEGAIHSDLYMKPLP